MAATPTSFELAERPQGQRRAVVPGLTAKYPVTFSPQTLAAKGSTEWGTLRPMTRPFARRDLLGRGRKMAAFP